MANYNTLKSVPLVYPEGNIDLGSPNHKFGNIYVTSNIAVGSSTINANNIITPKIASIGYPGDDLAADTAGGQTIVIIGTGFQTGATVLLDNAYVAVVTVVSDTRIEFISPVKIAGSYTLYVVNPDGGTAIFIPGVSYSGTPNWSTAAGSLGSAYETGTVNTSVSATGDAPVTYTLYTGTLPPGTTLNSSGVLSGTAPATAGSTTYTFTIRATDAQKQDTDRTFSLTVNPDAVTWNSPTDGYVSNVYEYATLSNITMNATSVAGKTITYTANSLPAGISIVGNTVFGTPTTIANTASNITANASSTYKTAYRTLNFNVLQDVVTWTSPADQTNYAVTANSAINSIGLSATSASGKSITYTANTLPNGISLSGNTISGTPTVVANSATLLTATAATTNRSATRTITWTVSLAAVLADAYWNSTSLLLAANTAVTTSSFVNDTSTNAALITVVGDTKPNNFNPYTPGYYSNYFGTKTNYISIPASTPLITFTGDFTFEAWVFPTDTSITNWGIWDSRQSGSTANPMVFSLAPLASPVTGQGRLMYFNGSYSYGTGTIYYNQWSHVAFVRIGSTMTFYVNGVAGGTATVSGTQTGSATTNPVWIGSKDNGQATYGTVGYISNFRIVNGTGVYTANFTPSTAPLTAVTNTALLACQGNRYIDSSTNAYVLTNSSTTVKPIIPFAANVGYATYGSAYFDGTGDYLSIPAATAFALDANYTIEAWVFRTDSSVQRAIVDLRGGGNLNILFYITPSNQLAAFNSTSTWITSTGTVPINQWAHVAITRQGTSCRLFINGVIDGTATNSDVNVSSGPVYIGRQNGSTSNDWLGYIADVRVLKGTALYVTGFTVPATPLTAIANTQLLTLQNNSAHNNSTFLEVSGYNNPITRYGNTTQGSFSPYGSNWSISCNATGCITVPASSNYTIGTNDFTMEFWMFPLVANQYVITSHSTGGMFMISIATGRTVGFDFNSSGGSSSSYTTTTSATTVTLNTWTHVAISRVGGTVYFYFNGTRDANSWAASGINIGSYGGAKPFYLGGGPDLGSYYSGYLSNFRHVVGTGLYSGATITVPTAPLSWVANTAILTLQNNRFVDNSTYNVTLSSNGTLPSIQKFSPFSNVTVPTYYSTYFNNSGNSITYSANGAGPTGTEDFTWECWWYFLTQPAGTYPRVFETTTANGFQIYFDGSTLTVSQNGGTIILTYSLTSVNAWVHLCITRSGAAARLFVNGVLRAYTASGGVNFATSTTGWRTFQEGTGPYGWISNLRVVRGSVVLAYQTSSTTIGATIFTPPTAPLTAISGTTLLTHQSSMFIDNSTTASTVTPNAVTITIGAVSPFTPAADAATTYSPFTFSGSMYFDGTGDYLLTNNINQASVTTFTIEAWVYITGGTGSYICSTYNSVANQGWSFIAGTTGITYGATWNGTSNYKTFSTTLGLNCWYHVAVTRSGSNLTAFVNGVSLGTQSFSGTWPEGPSMAIGYSNSTSYPANITGYITDFRLIQNVNIYPSNFSPPTAPLTNIANAGTGTYVAAMLMNGTSGGIVDASRTVNLETAGDTRITNISPYATGGVSYYFDGAGDYLNIPDSQALEPGAGNLTWEMWIKTTNSTANATLYSRTPAAFATGMWAVQMNMASATAGDVGLYVADYNTGTPLLQTTGVSVRDGNWHHIAVVRNGSAWVLYVDGVSRATGTWSGTIANLAYGPWVGKDQYYNRDYNGYIADLRITAGYARYTATFTPPTSAFLTK